MKNSLKIWNITWLHFENPQKQELIDIWEEYDLHEIVIDDIIDLTTQDKIDVYDEHIFMVLHFPKYDEKNKRYENNEFSFVLWKNFIITITSLPSDNIERIRDEYQSEINESEDDEKYKISPYYILYTVVDVMYDKAINILTKSNKDILGLEKSVFWDNWTSKILLEEIMIKKRNIVFLKHNFISQWELLSELQSETEKLYEWQIDLYYEDLSSKLDKIENNIDIQFKNINSIMDAYNSLTNIKLNSILTKLTVFTFIIWINTLIAWLYGMNVSLPMENRQTAFFVIIISMIIMSFSLVWLFKKNWWFE
jgi:magnesium transporter